jgi:ubiquitin-activating enzyme E1
MADPDGIDEGLYSRQLYALGREAMSRMSRASVLVSGMGGLGVEIAKNLVLAGVKNVTIHDESSVTLDDLASQYYVSESDIGRNRAIVSHPSLVALNEYVTVSACTDSLSLPFLETFNCVVLTLPLPESSLIAYDSFCREKGIKFIAVQTRGVFGFLFNDFGDDFVVVEPSSEKPSRFLIENITHDKEGIVTVSAKERHHLSDTDLVRFDEVEGMTELNGREFPVKVINFRTFSIGDTSGFGEYTCVHSNGYGNQVIPPITVHFKSLSEGLRSPDLPWFDAVQIGRDEQVLLAFWTLARVIESGGDFFEVAAAVNSELALVGSIDLGLLGEFLREDAVIAPTAAIYGGIAAQEVIKALSGKFTPFTFLASGYVESVPPSPVFEPLGDRYDPYRRVFGNALHEAITRLRYFVVGAGAIGCEILKNWALMGLGTGEGGGIIVTDMDLIERSNLNRQFLFHSGDIGKPKSSAAARAVSQMNPLVKIEAQQNRVGPESEDIYVPSFWESLSGVCNALDNVEARLYNDEQCVFFGKPLLESGTLGPIAHFEIIVPHLTVNYGANRDPPAPGIPQCTLHSFPSNITHCTMWGREQFFNLFSRRPSIAQQYLTDRGYVKKMMKADPGGLLENLILIEQALLLERPTSFTDCAHWARIKFEDLFVNSIRNLLHTYPPEHLEKGQPFWTGARRCPHPLVYDPGNPQHAGFITAAARLVADVYGIEPGTDAPRLALEATVPPWVPERLEIQTDEEQKDAPKKAVRIDRARMKDICERINQFREQPPNVNVLQFEKDDPTNGHIDFIAAAANLRAENYRIHQTSAFEIKGIAGNIIPALATTTAMICGFVSLEVYKVHAIEPLPIEAFRVGFINLSSASITLSQPQSCQKLVCAANGREFTLWDKWVIEGDLTIDEFVAAVKTQYGLDVDNLMIGSEIVFSSFLGAERFDKFKGRKIADIWVTDAQQPLGKAQTMIRINPVFLTRDELNTPDFYLKFR